MHIFISHHFHYCMKYSKFLTLELMTLLKILNKKVELGTFAFLFFASFYFICFYIIQFCCRIGGVKYTIASFYMIRNKLLWCCRNDLTHLTHLANKVWDYSRTLQISCNLFRFFKNNNVIENPLSFKLNASNQFYCSR